MEILARTRAPLLRYGDHLSPPADTRLLQKRLQVYLDAPVAHSVVSFVISEHISCENKLFFPRAVGLGSVLGHLMPERVLN